MLLRQLGSVGLYPEWAKEFLEDREDGSAMAPVDSANNVATAATGDDAVDDQVDQLEELGLSPSEHTALKESAAATRHVHLKIWTFTSDQGPDQIGACVALLPHIRIPITAHCCSISAFPLTAH